MYVPPRELKRTAEVSERLVGVAKRLLDVSSRTADAGIIAELNQQVKEIFDVVEDLNSTVASITAANV